MLFSVRVVDGGGIADWCDGRSVTAPCMARLLDTSSFHVGFQSFEVLSSWTAARACDLMDVRYSSLGFLVSDLFL